MAPHAQGDVDAKQEGRQGAAVPVGMTLLMAQHPESKGAAPSCCDLTLPNPTGTPALAVTVLLAGARWAGLPGSQALGYQQSVCSSNQTLPSLSTAAVSHKSETL